jgi:Stress responsive A/B Barrel Domain
MVERMQHVVLFKFPQDLTEDDERYMFEHVGSWPEKIGGFTRLRLGADVSGRSRGHQYLLFAEFEDEDRYREYFPHPVHQEFSDWVHARDCEVLALDYPLSERHRMIGS